MKNCVTIALSALLATIAFAGWGEQPLVQGVAHGANIIAVASHAPTDARRLAPSPSQQPAISAPPRWINISPPQVSTNGNKPPSNFGFQTIAIDPATPSTLYLGTCYQGLWKTTNGAKTWFKVNTGTNGQALNTGRLWSIALDHFHPQTIYAANGYGFGQGVWKSTDGGVDWQQMLPTTSTVAQRTSGDVGQIVTDPYRTGHLLVTFHSGWNGMKAAAGILESFDGGVSWIIHQPRPTWGGGAFAYFLDNSSTWLVGTQGDGFWRTGDRGRTWTKVARFVRADGPWGIYRATNGIWYAGGLRNILRSADDGRTWKAVGPAVGTGSYYTVIGDGHFLYAATAHSFAPTHFIYSPESRGRKWSHYGHQTFADGPFSMAYDRINHIVYSSNWLGGVWKLQEKR